MPALLVTTTQPLLLVVPGNMGETGVAIGNHLVPFGEHESSEDLDVYEAPDSFFRCS